MTPVTGAPGSANGRFGSAHALWNTPAGDDDWKASAACRDAEPSWFDEQVPGETRGEQAARHERAFAVCRRCPTTDACLASFVRGVDEGVRAGRRLPPLYPKKDKAKKDPPQPKEILHGTATGERMPYRRKEPACLPCRIAGREEKKRRDSNPDLPITHGTPYGAKRHRAIGERPCEDCLEAERVKSRAASQRKRMAS